MDRADVRLDAPTTFRRATITLRGAIEYTRSQQRPLSDRTRIEVRRRRTSRGLTVNRTDPPTRQDASLDKSFQNFFKSYVWIFHSDKRELWPKEEDDGAAGARDVPFELSLPATYPTLSSAPVRNVPLPPSYDMRTHGIRYHIKVRCPSPNVTVPRRLSLTASSRPGDAGSARHVPSKDASVSSGHFHSSPILAAAESRSTGRASDGRESSWTITRPRWVANADNRRNIYRRDRSHKALD